MLTEQSAECPDHCSSSVHSEGFYLNLVKIDFALSLILVNKARASACHFHLHILTFLFSNLSSLLILSCPTAPVHSAGCSHSAFPH